MFSGLLAKADVCLCLLSDALKFARNLFWIFIRGLNNAACGGCGLLPSFPDVIRLHAIHDGLPFGRETGLGAQGLFYKSGEECRW